MSWPRISLHWTLKYTQWPIYYKTHRTICWPRIKLHWALDFTVFVQSILDKVLKNDILEKFPHSQTSCSWDFWDSPWGSAGRGGGQKNIIIVPYSVPARHRRNTAISEVWIEKGSCLRLAYKQLSKPTFFKLRLFKKELTSFIKK